MNSKQSTHAALLVFLCFLGAAGGSAVASYAVQPDPIPPMPPSPPEPVIDPTPAVMEVLEEVRKLRGELSASLAQRSPADAGTTKPPEPALLARLEQLAAAIESSPGLVGSTESLQELGQRTPGHEKNRLLPEAVGGSFIDIDFGARATALTKQHLLWSAREVVAAYGMPDEVLYIPGTLALSYAIESSRFKVQFDLVGGVVTHVMVKS